MNLRMFLVRVLDRQLSQPEMDAKTQRQERMERLHNAEMNLIENMVKVDYHTGLAQAGRETIGRLKEELGVNGT